MMMFLLNVKDEKCFISSHCLRLGISQKGLRVLPGLNWGLLPYVKILKWFSFKVGGILTF